jgi:hypothetical protein
MLETNYTLNLGQLVKITTYLKKYLWQKLKANKPHVNTRLVNENLIYKLDIKINNKCYKQSHGCDPNIDRQKHD